MTQTAAPAGRTLSTALETVVTNPAGSGENRTYEIRFVNIDGQVSASITQCVRVDVSENGAEGPIVSNNTPVPPRSGGEAVRIVLEPGDSVKAAASANGDIYCLPQQIWSEKR